MLLIKDVAIAPRVRKRFFFYKSLKLNVGQLINSLIIHHLSAVKITSEILTRRDRLQVAHMSRIMPGYK